MAPSLGSTVTQIQFKFLLWRMVLCAGGWQGAMGAIQFSTVVVYLYFLHLEVRELEQIVKMEQVKGRLYNRDF